MMSGHLLEAAGGRNVGEGQDFKRPQNLHQGHCDNVSPGREDIKENERTCMLTLKTPENKLLTSDNNSLEVRKRALSPLSSPDTDNNADCHSSDVKRRHVTKLMFEETTVDEKPKDAKSAKCLFGTPSNSENDEVLDEYYKKATIQYEEFIKRYEIIEEL